MPPRGDAAWCPRSGQSRCLLPDSSQYGDPTDQPTGHRSAADPRLFPHHGILAQQLLDRRSLRQQGQFLGRPSLELAAILDHRRADDVRSARRAAGQRDRCNREHGEPTRRSSGVARYWPSPRFRGVLPAVPCARRSTVACPCAGRPRTRWHHSAARAYGLTTIQTSSGAIIAAPASSRRCGRRWRRRHRRAPLR